VNRLLLLLGLSAALAGCKPFLIPVSSAPPERHGAIDPEPTGEEDLIHLSKGVALGFECRESFWYLPCGGATAQTANGKIARVLPAHLDKYRNPWGQTEYYESDISHRTVFVVMGVEAGETELDVHSNDGDRHFHVIVDP
jgi:hypothetical protein